MKRLCLIALAILLPGCTSVNSSIRVEGWPELKLVEHYVSPSEVLDQCQKYAYFGGVAVACAEFDLEKNLCNVYYNKDFPPGDTVIAHEREHCAGYDHVGGTELQTLLDEWRKR